MLRSALHEKVSTILVEPSLLGDLRSKRAPYGHDGALEPLVPTRDPSSSPVHHSLGAFLLPLCLRCGHVHCKLTHVSLADTFDISNQHLSMELASAMCTVFQANPGVRYINFSGSNIVDRQQYMGKIMSCPRLRLQSLNLSFCKLGGGGAIKELANALLHMSSPVLELSLVGNEMNTQDVQDLSSWLETNTVLKLLDLGMNQKIGRAGLDPLAQALSRAGHPLQSLGLSGIGLNDDSVDALAQLVLDENFKAEFLDVSWNVLGVTGLGNLPSIFGKIKSVRELHCMALKLSPEATRRMIESYRGNHTIEVLHLASNYISVVSAPMFVELLQECPNMKWLDLVSNDVSPSFISTIHPAINAAHNLTILSLSNCTCNDEGAQILANVLSTNSTLLEVHFNFNNLTDAAAFPIASALKLHNKTLRNLRLDENEIGYDGVQALLEALQYNNSLVYLDLSENDFDPAQYETAPPSYPNVPSRVIKFVISE